MWIATTKQRVTYTKKTVSIVSFVAIKDGFRMLRTVVLKLVIVDVGQEERRIKRQNRAALDITSIRLWMTT
jgi:hypothetical protein